MTGDAPQPDPPSWAPGQILFGDGDIEFNAGVGHRTLSVVNTGDRPVQVGSHVHFPQANSALAFDRDAAHGMRLGVAAGTAVRFEPGVPAEVTLVAIGGSREVHGLTLDPPGRLGAP